MRFAEQSEVQHRLVVRAVRLELTLSMHSCPRPRHTAWRPARTPTSRLGPRAPESRAADRRRFLHAHSSSLESWRPHRPRDTRNPPSIRPAERQRLHADGAEWSNGGMVSGLAPTKARTT